MRQSAISVDHALRRLYVVCGTIAAFCIVGIAILVATSILSRIFGVYIAGLSEGAGYLMAAAGAFGLAHTFTSGGHIRVDLVLGTIPERERTIFEGIALALTTGAVFYLAWFLFRMVWISYKFGDLSDGSDGLPLWLPQLPAAIGFGIFALSLLHNFIKFCITGEASWRQAGDLLVTRDEA